MHHILSTSSKSLSITNCNGTVVNGKFFIISHHFGQWLLIQQIKALVKEASLPLNFILAVVLMVDQTIILESKRFSRTKHVIPTYTGHKASLRTQDTSSQIGDSGMN